MDLKRTNALVFSIICTIGNIILGNIMISLNIPALQLNTTGTIFTAVVYGPWFGALTGILTSIFTYANGRIAFVLISISIGIIVGFISRKKRFTFYNSLVIGLVIGLVSGIIGILANPFVYINLMSMISNNVVDKVMSCLIVSLAGMLLSKRFFKSKN